MEDTLPFPHKTTTIPLPFPPGTKSTLLPVPSRTSTKEYKTIDQSEGYKNLQIQTEDKQKKDL